MKKRELTDKQQSFVMNYVKNGFNAYKAALESGYTKATAQIQAHTFVKNPLIKERLANAYNIVSLQKDKELCMALAEKARVLSSIIYDIVPKDGAMPKRKYYSIAIKAIAELNAMQGDYAPDKKVSMNIDTTREKLLKIKKVYEEY